MCPRNSDPRHTAYAYDGDGVRLQADDGTATTDYLWDVNNALPQLALERDGSGGALRTYVRGTRMISMDAGSSTSYFHYDGLGSVANVTSDTGDPEWTYSYEPFGTARTETQDDPGAPDNVLRFAGELRDNTGLYHLRARQYDSTTGRFLSTDPLTPKLTESYASTYVYAKNRPTVLVDPSGMGSVWSGSDDVPQFCGSLPCYLESPDQWITSRQDVVGALVVTAGGAVIIVGVVAAGDCVALSGGTLTLECIHVAEVPVLAGMGLIATGSYMIYKE